jgi:PEGA domain
MTRWILVFLGALLLVLLPRAAFAQTAAELKKQGDLAMDALRYDDALAAYRAAYDKSHDPALLYNEARASQALGDYATAVDLLEQFEAAAPPALRARVPDLAGLEREVRGKVTTIALTCNVSGAEVVLRDKVVGTTPLAGPLRTSAGPATLTVRAEGYEPERRDLTLPGGQSVTIDIALVKKDRSAVLVVQSDATGATVSVDGKAVGTVPVESVVLAGRHDLTVARSGYETSATSFVIQPGERKELSIPLAATAPVTKKWWFWTGVVVVVGGGVATYFALTKERSADQGSISPGVVTAPLVRDAAGMRF